MGLFLVVQSLTTALNTSSNLLSSSQSGILQHFSKTGILVCFLFLFSLNPHRAILVSPNLYPWNSLKQTVSHYLNVSPQLEGVGFVWVLFSVSPTFLHSQNFNDAGRGATLNSWEKNNYSMVTHRIEFLHNSGWQYFSVTLSPWHHVCIIFMQSNHKYTRQIIEQ